MYEITMISLDQSAAVITLGIHASLSPVGEMLTYQAGMSLEKFLPISQFDAIITPGNSFGHMTGGFDGALVDYFGDELDQLVRQAIKSEWLGELPVGNAIRITMSDMSTCLIYAPTMRVPKNFLKIAKLPTLQH
jgi:hypothetical protein